MELISMLCKLPFKQSIHWNIESCFRDSLNSFWFILCRNIAEKRRQEEDDQMNGAPQKPSTVPAQASGEKRRNRWDQSGGAQ